jgi:histidinol-phosphate aminotransferase
MSIIVPNSALSFKSYISKSSPYTGGSTRDQKDKDLIKLSSNENGLGPSPMAMAAIRENLETLQEYRFENDGLLRDALEASTGLPSGQFITGNSGMELLDLICRGFLEPGSEVILCTPTFMAYKSFADLSGAKVVDVPLSDTGTDHALNPEGILRAVTSDTRLLFLSNPNNPTGSLIPAAVLDPLLDALPPHILVVYDEVYHHYVETTDYPQAADYVRQRRNLIGLHSFSKAYGLAGIRLGYAFARPEIAEYLRHLRRPFMINTLTTVAGIAALKDKEHIRRTKQLVRVERQWLYRQLETAGVHFWRSEANFILFRPPGQVAEFVEEMLRHGVMVRNAEPMSAPGCIRVTVGTRESNERFVSGLKKII